MINSDSSGAPANGEQPETTGRYIVVFADGEPDPPGVLRATAGVSNVADTRDFDQQRVGAADIANADAMVFSKLGVAVVSADQRQMDALRAASDRRDIASVTEELIHHVLADTESASAGSAAYSTQFKDSSEYTWGLQAVGADSSPWTGKGVKVAVLDTGLDLTHPDFASRSVTAESFVKDETAQDGHGHGTHCVGTSCGPRILATGPGYGVANEAEIFVGKVMSDSGSGTDSDILAGINWAVNSGCAAISMSLGANVRQVHPPYTAVGKRALDQGSMIIAAAGNNADRDNGNYGFVGTPANSPFIMAVGALDRQLDIAPFSARTLAGRGGQVDIAAPGVYVHSSWPMPKRYNTLSGTSMATPHVAGATALWAEATGYRGRELWSVIMQESRRLPVASLDAGAGLVRAPQFRPA
ncbi:S8 family serine peptidase [Arthrobacter castelli]|uniref:S8 family serine peptidase n=1 Tax=Arthrobacter castelli TaxID=271431 RepID=UPI0004112DC3|nr:S8 family serine peptidase [Arthrobacter castelli]